MPVFAKLNKQKSQSTMSLLYQKKDRELLNKYRICLKYVPHDVTSNDIERLCAKYGKVIDVTYSEKTPFKFVSFSSKSEMDKALEELKDNQYGFHASPAKNNNDDTASIAESLLDCIIDDDEDEISFKENRANRSVSLTRDRNQNRRNNSRFSRHRNQEKENQNLTLNKNDHHNNDKRGLQGNLKQSTKNDSSTDAMKETNLKRCTIQIEDKFSSDNKKDNDDSNAKISSATNAGYTDDVVGNCVLCMKLGKNACSRCGDCYCSLECQRNDWQRHRYFCLPMPSLIPLSHSYKSFYTTSSVQQSQQFISGGSNMNQIPPSKILHNKLPQQGAPIIAGNNGNFGNVMMPQRLLQMPQEPMQIPQDLSRNYNFNVTPGSYNAHCTPIKAGNNGNFGNVMMPQRPLQMPQDSPRNYNHSVRLGPYNDQGSGMQQLVVTQSSTSEHNYNNTIHNSRVSHKPYVPVIKHIATSNDKLSTVTSKKSVNGASSIEKDRLTSEQNKLTAEKDNSRSINDEVAVIKHIVSTVENIDELSIEAFKKLVDKVLPIETSSNEKDKLTAKKDELANDDAKQKEQNNSVKSDSTVQNENMNVDNSSSKDFAPFPTSGSLIQLTSILRPDTVYIRSLDTETNMQYLKCMNKINNQSKNSNNLTILPKAGDLVAAKYGSNGYCRALVLNVIEQNQITVLIIDYGILEKKTLKDLKELSDEAKACKRYVFPVHLKNLKNYENKIKEHKDEIMEYLDSYVECFMKDIKIVYDRDDIKDNSFEVELIDTTSDKSLNKHIIDLLQ